MIKHPLSFAGGVLVGVGIMYFFDPHNGPRRRARLRDTFSPPDEDLAGKVTSAAEDAVESVSDIASQVGK